MKTQILKTLSINKTEYYMLVFRLFHVWCLQESYSTIHTQNLISSKKLFDWFLREHTQQEESFLNYKKNYPKACKRQTIEFYVLLTSKKSNYPKALLEKIYKNTYKTIKINQPQPFWCMN
ncbi:conserved hypothetical protein [Tenacibaculum sp. 190524A02b]|uniref:Uncharacterized protein n=1 Tax=Tenacibaculum vairaonense TaxID=3137860 RepID=A0ABP1FET5_9FLAO